MQQEWQSPVTPSGLTDPEVDRYQPDAYAQQQAAAGFDYPDQQTVPDYMSGVSQQHPLPPELLDLQ